MDQDRVAGLMCDADEVRRDVTARLNILVPRRLERDQDVCVDEDAHATPRGGSCIKSTPWASDQRLACWLSCYVFVPPSRTRTPAVTSRCTRAGNERTGPTGVVDRSGPRAWATQPRSGPDGRPRASGEGRTMLEDRVRREGGRPATKGSHE